MFESIKGATSEDIATLALTMRADEKKDFVATFGDVEQGLYRCCLAASHGLQTVLLPNGDPIAIYGLTVGEEPKIAHPWLALSRHAEVYPFQVAKMAMRVMCIWYPRFMMFENRVPVFDTDAIKLLKFLGFSMEEKTESANGIEYQPFFMVGGA